MYLSCRGLLNTAAHEHALRGLLLQLRYGLTQIPLEARQSQTCVFPLKDERGHGQPLIARNIQPIRPDAAFERHVLAPKTLVEAPAQMGQIRQALTLLAIGAFLSSRACGIDVPQGAKTAA